MELLAYMLLLGNSPTGKFILMRQSQLSKSTDSALVVLLYTYSVCLRSDYTVFAYLTAFHIVCGQLRALYILIFCFTNMCLHTVCLSVEIIITIWHKWLTTQDLFITHFKGIESRPLPDFLLYFSFLGKVVSLLQNHNLFEYSPSIL